jgi:uncharacterized membrane protein YcaP (DUF421 family)
MRWNEVPAGGLNIARYYGAQPFRMDKLIGIDWQSLLIPTHSLAEIALRGTAMYVAIFLVFRFLLRQSGGIGIADLLVVVLIADAAQNAFSREYQSVTEGLLLVLTIVFWDFVLDWLGYRSTFFGWLTHRPPLALIEDGKLLRHNMRREMITRDELESLARKNGIRSLDEVRSACLEENGEISLVERNPGKKRRRKRSSAGQLVR